MIGGDFNVTRSQVDRLTNAKDRYPVNDVIDNIMLDKNLCDIWRVKHPYKQQFTWLQNDGQIASRLDYWLISDSIIKQVSEATITQAPYTDHKGVKTIHKKIYSNRTRGPGIWKLNDKLLLQQDYIANIKIIIINELNDIHAHTPPQAIIQRWIQFKEKNYAIY